MDAPNFDGHLARQQLKWEQEQERWEHERELDSHDIRERNDQLKSEGQL